MTPVAPDHLRRSSYALVVSTMLAAVGGMGYWLVAAHVLTVEELGVEAAAVSALLTASTIGQANAGELLLRLVPGSRSPRRTVARVYAAAAGASAVVGALFALVLVSQGLDGSALSVWFGVCFVLACAAWSVFTLQDAALTSMRQALWVPVENAGYSVAKLGVLAVLAAAGVAHPVLVSWVAPVPIIVVLVTVGLWRVGSQPVSAVELAPIVGLNRAAAADGVGTLVSRSALFIAPMIVGAAAGASDAGAFYVPYSVVTVLFLAQASLAMPLTVEGSLAPERLADLTRRTVKRSLLLTTPAVAVLVLGAPLLLVLYGDQYGDASRRALMILAVTALPRGLLQCHWAAMRVVTDGRQLFSTQVLLGVLLLASTWIGAKGWGIEGAAVGITGSHLAVMVLCLPDLFARMREPAGNPAVAPAAVTDPVALGAR
ncbi:MAG: hypothetical protein JWL70_2200 [Acidimicrobiia bacterium]|nr:hypothetical protein [Acidimicrobiia bacterium]